MTNRLDIENLILSSVMFSDEFNITAKDDEWFKNLRLNLKHFSLATLGIATIINKLKDHNGICNELAVEATARNNNLFNENVWLGIISTNPMMSERQIKFFLNLLKTDYTKNSLSRT